MKKAAVIGFPISHSLSPILHNFLLKKYEIDGSYEAISIDPSDLEKKFDDLIFSKNYQGLNVTIPHKTAIFDLFTKRNYKITKKAQLVGAINTIYQENGEIIGSNSDIYGFEKNLLTGLGGNSKTRSALIIGAGGVASCALFSLSFIFDKIYVVNRSSEKAQILAKNITKSLEGSKNIAKIEVIESLTHEINQNLDLLVNCTSIGMAVNTKNNNIEHFVDIEKINNGCTIYDLVYNPLHTDLLQAARKSGKPTITGIGMLIYQAFEGFEKWFGVKPELDEREVKELSDVLILDI